MLELAKVVAELVAKAGSQARAGQVVVLFGFRILNLALKKSGPSKGAEERLLGRAGRAKKGKGEGEGE